MTSADADTGLLAPGWTGSPAASSTGDTAYLRALLDAEAALTRAQAALGLVPAAAGPAVTSAADTAAFDVTALAERARSGGNPVIPLVADLTEAVGEAYGPYVHRGATSQDIMDTATMLVAARTLDLVLADLGRTESALAALAAAHRDTAMPGRTLTQHAVPTTFGLKAAGWRSLVLDARDRLAVVRASLPAQLGGAAGTLAAFTVFRATGAESGADAGADSEAAAEGVGGAAAAGPPAPSDMQVDTRALVAAYARELGLREPELPWHTLRTPIADLAGALAFTAGALGKIAADVLTLARTEIAEVAEGSGGGSSAMPHKANPVRSTLIAAAARRAPQLAATLYGAPVAEDERPAGAWHAEWEPLRDLLRLVGGAARDAVDLVRGLRVNAGVMRAHLDLTHGLIVSERLAAELAPVLGRARAKELLTRVARRVHAEGRPLAELLAEEPELRGLDLTELTDPTHYTGSAGALTDRALERR
ncbi:MULTISPECIES: 3-carboxy-cis,cis-muconate cycloisomerase [Streptomyces]|uniref:3-carboxy-cis,cis-muconate cycloisomerase n=1 Tax=Streptomyces stelliscabiei TaxID=146820 RepID=A0A8I0TXS9_9ACTN|nr:MULTISPECIES: 3-carboxy-cis,cis-muconate cycloisomerase [Streptomyces]KND44655.1 3-carboxy-cis,cis-muconate cycloisomerase [Streptomyces stelliscabiei]MBE1601673.1 3-carboxy-cis,cis-muconate cycloisomerase [Streptomyces stelliscabiei]MDX2515018.1 3-carboxy-cis,cis-muconate cycloisomerase [Streptomyces stelliscabiei]MDX2555290.1 3-carboxy-cis,cis-muconate cycloisomerase [Streptomyces stelliscabiei]MDX2612979.1 3-carboxy-cis,cis-muconate cycloisomerase [Streptomyces stelliscabiei]